VNHVILFIHDMDIGFMLFTEMEVYKLIRWRLCWSYLLNFGR